MTGVFEGLGSLQFSPDNKYAYAYSEIKTFSDTAATLLNFTNGSEYLVAQLLYQRTDTDSLDSQHRVYFNDQQVAVFPLASGSSTPNSPNTFIIPPFTDLKVDLVNVSNTSNGTGNAIITAKVKGAIEQKDLEAITDGSKWAK